MLDRQSWRIVSLVSLNCPKNIDLVDEIVCQGSECSESLLSSLNSMSNNQT